MTDAALEVLRSVFGYDEFRSNQQEIIQKVLGGGDALVLMPSGGGKSLCYQIPAIVRPGTGIVVSPLISLMKDQVDALRLNGVRAAAYNSSLEPAEARKVLTEFTAGRLDMLYVSPERVLSDAFLRHLERTHRARADRGDTGGGSADNRRATGLALFAIDEAHCISQWGHDFRPEYVALGGLREHFPDVPLVALTATADPHTREDIRGRLGLRRADLFVSSFDRPNIRLRVVEKRNPRVQLRDFLDSHPQEAGVIYCTSRKRTEDLAAHLVSRGVAAAAYHAGLPADERVRVQEDFIADRVQIVVATVAFGMGIDKTNVRFVVHWDLPQHLEGYYQEIGRSGRDGMPAEALLLFGWEDVPRVRALIELAGDTERAAVELHKLNSMVGFAQALTCRRRVLLGYLGETMEDDCGNCDVCLDPPELYDATIDVQKALSCVYRVGERFGAGHVIDILRGSEKERVLQLGHDRLPTYGVGADLTVDSWRSVLRQLIHLGYLRQEMGQYPVLRLTPASAEVLRGHQTVTLARPRTKVRRDRARGPRGQGRRRQASGTLGQGGTGAVAAPGDREGQVAAAAGATDQGEAVFQGLRALRRTISEREKVPPYVVFHDATLREMAEVLPTTSEELLEITGVGERKLERFGDEFLELLRTHAAAD